MSVADTRIVAASSASARIIAAGIVIAFCYWASEVLVTLLVAVLLAYFLDPVVTWFENLHVPRALGSLLIVLMTIALLMIVGWTLMERVNQFSTNWAKYRKQLGAAVNVAEKKLENFDGRVRE